MKRKIATKSRAEKITATLSNVQQPTKEVNPEKWLFPLNARVNAYFDGACEPRNPGGHIGYGALIEVDGNTIFEHSGYLQASSDNSNNVAEYLAFESLINFIIEKRMHERHTIYFYGDSKLVIMQMAGIWRMNGGYYIPIAKRCLNKLECFSKPKTHFQWLPREKNFKADELSKRELITRNVEFRIQQPNEYR